MAVADKTLSPDRRAEMVLEKMTLDEKLTLVSGSRDAQTDPRSLGGAGFVPPIDRLGIPSLQMTNGRSGLAQGGRRGRYAWRDAERHCDFWSGLCVFYRRTNR